MKMPSVLKNKYILYTLLVIAIVNILGYLAIQDYNSLALFVVLGLLSIELACMLTKIFALLSFAILVRS